jgi:HlyD family secretion protein
VSILISILIIILALIGLRLSLNPELDKSLIVTAVAETGSLEAAINASGQVVPKYEQVITSPIQTNILSIYHKAGEKVKKGDQIIKLNKEFLLLSYEKLKDELELQKIKKLKQEINLKNGNYEKEINLSIKELNTRYNEAKCKRQEQLFKIGGTTVESLEEAMLNLEISRKDKENLKTQIDNQVKLQQAELDELDLAIRIGEKNLRQIERQLELSDVIAQGDGIITWINEKNGAAVSAGEKIASVADISSFQIEASVSDIHASKLYIGAPVKIKINDTLLRGYIISINPVVSNGIINFRVALSDGSNTVLRPNLRVEVYVITSVKKNIVRVKNGSFFNGTADQTVFIINKNNYAERRRVEFGESDYDYVEIKSGISPGETVIISDMVSYENLSKIKIKNP